MDTLKKIIQEKKPKLAASSIQTYTTTLFNLYKNVFPEDKKVDYKKYDNNTEAFLDYLKDIEPSKRKSKLASLVILTDNNKYREVMLNDIEKYNVDIKTNKENPNKDYINEGEIEKLYNKHKKLAMSVYKKNAKDLTNADYQTVQNYIIVCLYGGLFIQPRRSQDYVRMKIKGDINKNTDNYIDVKNKKFVFNMYKTKKYYGTQSIDIPKDLMTILNKYMIFIFNKSDYLLFDINFNPLTNIKLNQRINKIFGRKIGVNAFRTAYLTNKYSKAVNQLKAASDDLNKMGSSISQINNYVKL